MKKLMTSTIILLPLLLLAIMLVSGAIMSLVTHIYVEQVEFVGNGALVLVMEDEAEPPTEKLEVNILPLKAENRGLSYSVVDEDIATVDQNGNITARDYGETYVTVTSKENKAAVARRKVLVTDSHVHRISINDGYSRELYENATEELHVSVIPKEAENKSVKWESSNPDILFVSANGTVTAKGEGTATITATSYDNPSAVATTEVITCHKKLLGLKTESALTPVVTSLTEAQFPEVKPVPEVAKIMDLTYTSSDTSIATVDKNGKITFKKEGHVRITATATDFGGTTATVSREYTSTDGYYLSNLFSRPLYTVDFDEYFQEGEATKRLPIPFAAALKGSKKEFIRVEFSVPGVLGFDETVVSTEDEEKLPLYFTGEMPAGTRSVTVTVYANVYDSTQQAIKTEHQDSVTVEVRRNATRVDVAYGGTENVSELTIENREITFSTTSAGANNALVTVFPANHTNSLSFVHTAAEGVATMSGNTLTFQKDGTATVNILLKSENDTVLSRMVIVHYVPSARGQTNVHVDNNQENPPAPVVLNSTDATGVLYYAEPANATVTYTVKEEAEGDPDPAVKLEEVDGVRHVIPRHGGFATIVITVTPGEAEPVLRTAGPLESGDETGAYTIEIEVYVDLPVGEADYTVKFNDTLCEKGVGYDAQPGEISFTVSVENVDSRMEGKRLVISYGNETVYGDDGADTYTGTITLENGDLPVTFGVQYTQEAKDLGAKGNNASTSRTILCNANGIDVTYGNVKTTRIVTHSDSLTFGEKGTNAIVAVSPAKHTDTLSYALEKAVDGVTLNNGKLTFTSKTEVSVTVLVQLKRGGEVTYSEEVTVIYVPESTTKVVEGTDGEKVRLAMSADGRTSDMGTIYFTEPESAKVTYAVAEGGKDVVEITKSENGVQQIKALKGGFADVTITAGEDTRTISVYVDCAINEADLQIDLGKADTEGTTLTEVPYTVTVNGLAGNMEGKKIVVSYSGKDPAEGYKGTIAFPKESRMRYVTFKVEYDAAKTAGFEPKNGLATTSRTLQRNGESIAVKYDGVVDAQTIVIQTAEFTFDNNNVTVVPTAHTDTLHYELKDAVEGVLLTDGKLTFTENTAASVKVLVQLTRGEHVTLEKELTVVYAPLNGATEVKVGQKDETKYLVFAPQEEGILYFTESVGKNYDYTPTKDSDVISFTYSNGAQHIKALKGGFATVTITAGDETHTINIYVDEPVSASGFTIKLDSKDAENFGTTGDTVSYTFTLEGADGRMEGKKLVVTYEGTDGNQSGTAGKTTHSGDISFPKELSELEVTFAVVYDDATKGYGVQAETLSGVSKKVTIVRDAEEVTVSHKGTNVEKIQISKDTLTFVTGETSLGTQAGVVVTPANHKNKIKYSLVDGANTIATITEGGVLTFKSTGEVTVRIQLMRGSEETIKKDIAVSYAPLALGEKEIEVNETNKTQKVVLRMNGDAKEAGSSQETGRISFTEPEGADVTYTIDKGEGIIELPEPTSGEAHRIVPKKGGFATVKISVAPEAGAATQVDAATYTIEIYVDYAVKAGDFKITLGGSESKAENFETALGSVPYTVAIDEANGSMVGKKFKVTYSGYEKAGENSKYSLTDKIDHPETAQNTVVTFEVVYTDEVNGFEVEEFGLSSTTRTIRWNTTNVTVAYTNAGGTVNAAKRIVLSAATFDFSNAITVTPAWHTDAISYKIKKGDAATIKNGSTLTFEKEGVVTVTLEFRHTTSSEPTFTKDIEVVYAKSTGHDIYATTKSLVLKKNSSTSDMGTLYFTEAENTTVTYSVTGDGVIVGEKAGVNKDGAYQIKALKGGEATVTISENGAVTHTIKVYVDYEVLAKDLTVTYSNDPNGAQVGENYGTTADKVTVTVTVAGDGRMAGKALYYKLGEDGELTAMSADGVDKYTATIAFPTEGGNLKVTFVVKYDKDKIAGYEGLNADEELVSVNRTLLRDAASATVDFGDVQGDVQNVQKIVTTVSTLNFGEAGTDEGAGKNVKVHVLPETHTDQLYFEIDGVNVNNGYEFKNGAASVTLNVYRTRDGGKTKTKLTTITIVYAPLNGATEIKVGQKEESKHLVLEPNKTGILYFTEVADKTYDYKVTKGDGAITLANEKEDKSGAWKITAVHGGFATVTITAGDETHTINIYVDRTVSSEDFTVTFDGKPVAGFSTTSTQVVYEITVANADAMQGKDLYMVIGGNPQKLTLQGNIYTDTINFPMEGSLITEKGDLEISFYVQYNVEDAYKLGTSEMAKFSCTLLRDTASVTVTYGDIKVYEGGKQGKIVTSKSTLTFGEAGKTEGTKDILVTATPTAHSDSLVYKINDGAKAVEDYTFGADACVVTLKVYSVRGRVEKLLAEVTIVYEPAAQEYDTEKKDVVLTKGAYSTEDTAYPLVLTAGFEGDAFVNKMKGSIYLTLPAGATAKYEVVTSAAPYDKGTEVVEIQDPDAVPHIVAKKGGFALIHITVSGTETVDYWIKVYVDIAINSSDLTVGIRIIIGASTTVIPDRDRFYIYYAGVRFVRPTISIDNSLLDSGAMIGKYYYVELNNKNVQSAEGASSLLTSNLDCSGLEAFKEYLINYSVRYGLEAAKLLGKEQETEVITISREIVDTDGVPISAPTVTYTIKDETKTLVASDDVNDNINVIEMGIDDEILLKISANDPLGVYAKDLDYTIKNGSTLILSSKTDDDPCVITLKPTAKTTEEETYIQIGKQRGMFVYNIKITVKIMTTTMKVEVQESTKTGEKADDAGWRELNEYTEYKTVLGSFKVKVTHGRNDGKDISTQGVQYSFDLNQWTEISGFGLNESEGNWYTSETIIELPAHCDMVYFRSADGAVSKLFRIERVDISELKYDFEIFVYGADGTKNYLAPIESANMGALNREDTSNLEIVKRTLPGDMQGGITFQIAPRDAENFLGGFGSIEEFKSNVFTKVESYTNSTWVVPEQNGCDPYTGQIIFDHTNITSKSDSITMTCSVGYGKYAVKVEFTRYNYNIEFPGFDSGNPTDIYKGYQQVRVFAKHSDYAENGVSNVVDYFKLPIKATNSMGEDVTSGTEFSVQNIDLGKLVWTFTGYKGKEAKDDFKYVQTISEEGDTITFTYGETEYTIVKVSGGPSTLKQGETVIAEGGVYKTTDKKVPWVDVYAEAGYAYVYFGDFGGLSEKDVQNDLFGAFDDDKDWEAPTNVYDVEGNAVTATDGSSYTFLRIDANFGGISEATTSNSKTCHFNFNILADPQDGDLVNVFNATGYYAHNKLVLHNNLYGGTNSAVTGPTGSTPNPDADCNKNELTGTQYENAKAQDLILDKPVTGNTQDSSYANKNTVYGNGYQINLNALNTMIINDGSILNNNGKAENSGKASDFTNIYNVNLKGRNDTDTVIPTRMGVYFQIHNAYYSTIQNYGKLFNTSLHAKNTVFRNVAMAGIELWGGTTCVDYLENIAIVNVMRAIICETMFSKHTVNLKGSFDVLNYHSVSGLKEMIDPAYSTYIAEVVPQLQSYVEWFGGTKPNLTAASVDMFVNPAIISTQCAPVVKVWDESQGYVALDTSTASMPLIKAADKTQYGMTMFTAYTYNYQNSIENGADGTRDMSKLLTKERYIRLLCEYLNVDAGGNLTLNTDHILWHIQKVYRDPSLIVGRITDHEAALKDSLKGKHITWPDGTKSDDALAAAETNAAALTSMISQTVLPSKFIFE